MSRDKWLTQKNPKETIILLRDLIYTCANSDGLINCLPASPVIETNLLLHDKGFAGHGLQPGLFYLSSKSL